MGTRRSRRFLLRIGIASFGNVAPTSLQVGFGNSPRRSPRKPTPNCDSQHNVQPRLWNQNAGSKQYRLERCIAPCALYGEAHRTEYKGHEEGLDSGRFPMPVERVFEDAFHIAPLNCGSSSGRPQIAFYQKCYDIRSIQMPKKSPD